MSRHVFRYRVGLDEVRMHKLTGDPLFTDAQPDSDGVEFWAEHDDDQPERERTFMVFGTGQAIPPGAKYVATARRTGIGLVWHLYELCGEGTL